MSSALPTTGRTATETRALELLGTGTISKEDVALACGVTASRISQLLADPEFSEEVSLLRFKNLKKNNDRDDSYDRMEDKLIKQLDMTIPMMSRPAEIARVLQMVNGAKRRGMTASSDINSSAPVINLTLPAITVQRFKTNINNQVISAGAQDLITVQSSEMSKMLAKRLENNQVILDSAEQTEHSGESLKGA